MVLLVIDEAQNLSLAALEELRMLSNLETEKSKLMQIVLIGQPNLRDKLSAPDLEQLRQRITVSYHLLPLDADETANYINHRLRRAALGAPMEFPREATELIHLRSRGIPRVINVICDAALVFGYAEDRRLVNRALITDVLTELETTGVLPTVTDPVASAAAATATSATAATAAARASTAAASATAAAAPIAATAGAASVAAVTAPVDASAPATAVASRELAGVGVARSVDVRRWPPASPRAADEDSRALAQREQTIQQRERELAEQRRILAEEYRLLRAQHAAATAGAARAVRVVPAPRVEPARFRTKGQEGFWAWLRRVMLGVSQPAVEKN
jgi:hypothetical protein